MTDARIKKSNHALMESSVKLLLVNPQATMSEVAVAAGVGRATLYRHYPTKLSLIEALAETCVQELDAACAHIEAEAQSATQAIELLFSAMAPQAEKLKVLALLDQYDSSQLKQIRARQDQEILELIEWLKQEKAVDNNVPNDWLLILIDNLIYSSWILMGKGFAADVAASLALRTFLSGVGTR
ncbi:MAG: TetR/AcrR family transcriptional regulator [Pseudomonadales bacterium]|nr:TetR/AcrR family transcriptional regulator [Pseudomonadales bacterium]